MFLWLRNAGAGGLYCLVRAKSSPEHSVAADPEEIEETEFAPLSGPEEIVLPP
jgi:hypothetical protein